MMTICELPPEQGRIVAITLDAISRVYDLGVLLLGGERLELGGTMTLILQSSGAFHYKFGPTNVMTVDELAADAAGATPTFQANAAALAPANETIRFNRWNRREDRYLAVRGGTSVLRIWVASKRSNR